MDGGWAVREVTLSFAGPQFPAGRVGVGPILSVATEHQSPGDHPKGIRREWMGNAGDVGGVLWAFGKPFRHADAWKNFLRATSKGGEEGTAT